MSGLRFVIVSILCLYVGNIRANSMLFVTMPDLESDDIFSKKSDFMHIEIGNNQFDISAGVLFFYKKGTLNVLDKKNNIVYSEIFYFDGFGKYKTEKINLTHGQYIVNIDVKNKNYFTSIIFK